MSPEDVARALDGDRQAMQALVQRLLPVVQAEVGHALRRGARIDARDPREEIRDLVQEVFIRLLNQDGKALRSWDPERGRSLDSFVRLVARRHVAAVMRSSRRNPWTDKPVAGDELEQTKGSGGDAKAAEPLETTQRLDRLLEQLHTRLDERGMLLFRMLYVEERTVEEVMEATQMTRDAVYAWRSRFRKLIVKLAEPAGSGDRKRDA